MYATLQSKRDEAAVFAASLAVHCTVLFGLWHYQSIPPQPEALTVFVSLINPATPAKITEPVVQKPIPPLPVKQESPPAPAPAVAPVPPKRQASAVPASLPAAPAAAAPRDVKPPPAVVSAGSSAAAPVAAVPATAHVAATQPVLQAGELAVSCSERPPPVYPKQSLRLGEQGKTVLLVELDELGRMVNVAVTTQSGFPRLDEAAVNAVKSWRCNPAQRNGVAVRSKAMQSFNFTLKGR